MSKPKKVQQPDWFVELPPELEAERARCADLYRQVVAAKLEMVEATSSYMRLKAAYGVQREYWREVFEEHRRLRAAEVKE